MWCFLLAALASEPPPPSPDGAGESAPPSNPWSVPVRLPRGPLVQAPSNGDLPLPRFQPLNPVFPTLGKVLGVTLAGSVLVAGTWAGATAIGEIGRPTRGVGF